MAIYVRNGAVWSLAKEVYVNNGGTWVEPQEVYVRDAVGWKLLHKTITIAADTNNVNLFTLAGSPTTPIRLKVTIATGVIIGSSSVASPSFTIAGFPAATEILIINNGSILGAGGTGAAGANWGGAVNSATAGGTALSVSSAVRIQNNGTVAGGGGGGGAGGYGNFSQTSGKTTTTYQSAGSGGGGGAGRVGGAGGAGGTGGNYAGNTGGAGTATAGGNGAFSTGTGLSGGNGGALGVAGTAGTGTSSGAGAVAGSYAVGNANITWEVVGTRLGSVS